LKTDKILQLTKKTKKERKEANIADRDRW